MNAILELEDFGEWEALEPGSARLHSTAAPWRKLLAELDREAAASKAPSSALDEADAIVACCWRYGSYAHVLCNGEPYPDFSKPSLSRITQDEMQRINIEFSAGVAAWLTALDQTPDTIHRRVQAALSLLPMPWRTRRRKSLENDVQQQAIRMVARFSAAFTEADVPAAPTARAEANALVAQCYRNGPIEAMHAGASSEATQVPGYRRLYKADIDRIASEAAQRIATYLAVRSRTDPSHPARRAYIALSPPDWSQTAETSDIVFGGAPHLHERVARMAQNFEPVKLRAPGTATNSTS